jgi:dienelactone hydrolase
MLSSMQTVVALVAVWAGTVTAVSAKLVTERVAYEHDGVPLSGVLVYDDQLTAAGKLPGVLVVHEWWGLNEFAQERATAIARLGYVGFALDMYGAGQVADDPKRAGELAGQFYGKPLMAERARAGLEAMLATGLVDETRVASIGFCFGGAVSQALAYSGAPLAGMVSFHGSLIAASAEAAQRNRAKFLICHGAADNFIPKENLDAFIRSLDAGGVDYQFISYAGGLHAFMNPGADAVREKYGLNIAYHPDAARRAWGHMQQFFSEIFAR